MREDLIRVGYCMAAVPVRRMRILEIIRPNYTLCGVMARATHSKIELFIVIQLFCLWRWCMVVLWPWWLLPWLHDCETGFNIFIIHGFRVWEAWAGRQQSNRINQICVWVCMNVCVPYQCYHCNGLNMSMSHVLVWAWEVRWHCDILHWDCSDLIIDANMWHNGDTRWVVTHLSPLSHMSHVTIIKPHELPHIRPGDTRDTNCLFTSWLAVIPYYDAMITFHVPLPTHLTWIHQHNQKYGLHFLHQRSLCCRVH